MRPQGRGELDSLYFNYPHFDAPVRVTAQDTARLSEPTPIVIVGAGPVGMVAALTLAQRGVACVLLDNKASFNDGSRAICVSRSSMHIFQSLGVVQPFLNKALPWVSGRSFFRGKEILEFFMPDTPQDKYRPMYNIQQQYIEAYLYEAVAAQPLIDVRWQSEVTQVIDLASGGEGGAEIQVKDPYGTYKLHTDYLIAADGARSRVRSAMGLRLQGNNFEGRYVIADIRIHKPHTSEPRKTERLALFDPACRPGGTVLIHQQPDDIWRIDYQLRDGESEADALLEGHIRASVAAVIREIGLVLSDREGWELEWWSVYSANTLALDTYRHGNAGKVFFIGDSAHIVPIFGVRGLNNGLADAHNLGWKLAHIISQKPAPHITQRLLDTYNTERRGATLDVFANASKSASFMTPQTRGWTLLRDSALSLALTQPFAGQFANPRQMTPYRYTDSALTAIDGADASNTCAFSQSPKLGDAAPNARLDGRFLLDQMGLGFTLLLFGETPPQAAFAHLRGLTVVHVPINSPAALVYAMPNGSAVLIRPDWHIAARWQAVTFEDVSAYYATVLGYAENHPSSDLA